MTKGGGGFPGKKMSLGLSYGPIVSSLDNQAALRKRNMAQQNHSRGSRPTMAIRDARSVRARMALGEVRWHHSYRAL